jgi:cytochrome P450
MERAANSVSRQTKVSIFQYAMYHTSQHWSDPFSYHPERFLGDERFSNDKLECLQPFHIGPRNCIGRT